ncbi:SCO family protein [Paenibacillus methanolicus]|uniref:Protein SCO1/2 n=1 Tax=Paenibacillus methanolicus TaxID=582686 RepID=A0A5S5BW03_9BACL|nr:SCO family protein [Paenibacillus methanolicus]TYP71365.1 protein SCO1/2 [Paenibacillus methanolicus]
MAFVRKHAFKIALFALCAAMGIYLLVSMQEKSTVNFEMDKPAPNYTMTDLDGNQVQLSDSDGKVRLIYFYYANCPDICPPTTFLMSELQNELKADGTFGKDVEFHSVTFDPERDKPDAVRQFIANIPNEIDQTGWKFLNMATEQETTKLMTEFGLMLQKDPATKLYTHSDLIFFVDKKGNIRKYVRGSLDELMTADKLKEITDALLDD